jgi:hypothetical protein
MDIVLNSTKEKSGSAKTRSLPPFIRYGELPMESNEVFEYGYRNGRQLSHFLVDVTGHGRDNLARALAIAFTTTVDSSRPKRATHFRIDGTRQLTLFASRLRSGDLVNTAEPFSNPFTYEEALAFVWDWLQKVEYPQDEHDGASIEGWRVFNQQFGIVDGCWEAFIAIQPMWIYIPK